MNFLFLLDYQDSNLEKQDQNLLCYHYTIVQSLNRTTRSVFDDAKILGFVLVTKKKMQKLFKKGVMSGGIKKIP